MKTAVVSYSYTGNNERLAKNLAKKMSADHVIIKEPKKRSMFTIMFDIFFKRTPKVQPMPDTLDRYDMLVFCGPVWMGKVATPLRKYLSSMKPKIRYAYTTICGGAKGPNPGLKDELTTITGRAPAALIDMHKADLMDVKEPTVQQTMKYNISDKDVEKLSATIVKRLKKVAG